MAPRQQQPDHAKNEETGRRQDQGAKEDPQFENHAR